MLPIDASPLLTWKYQAESDFAACSSHIPKPYHYFNNIQKPNTLLNQPLYVYCTKLMRESAWGDDELETTSPPQERTNTLARVL